VTVRRFIFYDGSSIGGSAHFNCLKFFLRERIDIKNSKISLDRSSEQSVLCTRLPVQALGL
jgi:hypothetical protein